MIDYEWIFFVALVATLSALVGRYAIKKRLDVQRKKYGFNSADETIPLDDILQGIEAEETWSRAEYERLSDKIFALRNPAYEHMAPVEIVALATKEETKALQEITGEVSLDPVALVDALRDIGSNALAQIWRMLSPKGKDISVSYEEILRDACKHFGVRDHPGNDIYALEVQLQRQAFSKVLESMPEQDRQRFLKEFSTQSLAPGLGKEAWVSGGIVVANLSGFGLYLASSTALGAITSAIGVTLPFAVYTGMSSTIAMLIGPVGWVALGAWVIHKLGKPSPNKVVAGTLMVANIRQRLIAVRDESLPRIKNDRDVVLRKFQMNLSGLREKLQLAKNYCSSDLDAVSRSAYALPERPKLYGN